MKQRLTSEEAAQHRATLIEVMHRELGDHEAVAGGVMDLDTASEGWERDDRATAHAELVRFDGERCSGTFRLMELLMAPCSGWTIESIASTPPKQRVLKKHLLWFALARKEVVDESGEHFLLRLAAVDFSGAAGLALSAQLGNQWLGAVRRSGPGVATLDAIRRRTGSQEVEKGHLAFALTEFFEEADVLSGSDGGPALRQHTWSAFDAAGVLCMTTAQAKSTGKSRFLGVQRRFQAVATEHEFGTRIHDPRSEAQIVPLTHGDRTWRMGTSPPDGDPLGSPLVRMLGSMVDAANTGVRIPSQTDRDAEIADLAVFAMECGIDPLQIRDTIEADLTYAERAGRIATAATRIEGPEPSLVKLLKTAGLSPREIEIYEHRWLVSGSNAETARHFGISAQAVGKSLKKAQAKRLAGAGLPPPPCMAETASKEVASLHEVDLLAREMHSANETNERGEEETA